MKLACSMVSVSFKYSTGLSNYDFSSFKNSNKEARLLRNDILSIRYDVASNCPDLQTFTSYITNKTNESRARSPSHSFTGKSEQTIPQWNPREQGRRFHGVTFSSCSWRNAFW